MHRTAQTGAKRLAVFTDINLDIGKVCGVRVDFRIAQYIHATARVIGNCVLDRDLPVFDPGIDDLEAGDNALCCSEHVSLGVIGAGER